MRSVLASLEVIAKPGENNKKSTRIKKEGDDIDKVAMYAEMRSSKIMKRKWKDANLDRGPKPEKAVEA